MDKFCADHGVSRSEVRFIDADGDDELDPGLAPTVCAAPFASFLGPCSCSVLLRDDAYDYEGGEVLDVSRV